MAHTLFSRATSLAFSCCMLASFALSDSAISMENRPPTIHVSVEPVYCRGDYVVIPIRATDPDGDLLNYRIDPSTGSLPEGLALNSGSPARIRGVLKRTGSEGSSTNYDVTVVATDKGGLSASFNVNIFSIACEEPRISLFKLVDATKDTDLQILRDDNKINLQKLPKRLTIRADAYPATLDDSFYGSIVESVRFILDGVPVRIEDVRPYALGGDKKGDYTSFTLLPGTHSLTAIPYTTDNAGGTEGLAKTIYFNVVED